jgi:hypothetical protein
VGLAATVPERSRAVRSVLQPGQKNPSLAKKAPLAGVAAIWAGAARRNASHSRHVLAQYDEKFPCDILFNFFEVSWLVDDVRPSQPSLFLVDVTK